MGLGKVDLRKVGLGFSFSALAHALLVESCYRPFKRFHSLLHYLANPVRVWTCWN